MDDTKKDLKPAAQQRRDAGDLAQADYPDQLDNQEDGGQGVSGPIGTEKDRDLVRDRARNSQTPKERNRMDEPGKDTL